MSHIHIPDGVLPTWLWVLGWVVTLAGVTVAGRVAERSDVRRRVPLLSVMAALMVVAMSSEIVPLAYHVNLTVIGGVLLGPVLSIIAAFIIEVILALLGHGGVSVLGLNTVVIASEMVLGWAAFKGLMVLARRRSVRVPAFIATALTLAVTTSLVVGIVALSGISAAERETGALDPSTLKFENPFAEGVFELGLFSGGEHEEDEAGPDASAGKVPDAPDGAVPLETEDEHGLSVGRFAAVVYTLGPFGWLLEALLTAWVLGYVARVRPGLLTTALGDRLPGDDVEDTRVRGDGAHT